MSRPRAARRWREQLGRAFPEPAHHAIAFLLRHPAVQRLRAKPRPLRVWASSTSPASGRTRARRPALEVEDAAERVHLLRARDEVGHLPDAGGGAARELLLGDGQAHGILEVPLRDGGDALGHGRGEQGRLSLGGEHGEDGLELFGESHVQHLVRLVEPDRFHVPEIGVRRRMVESTAGWPPRRRRRGGGRRAAA
jgi:hypothetical protein